MAKKEKDKKPKKTIKYIKSKKKDWCCITDELPPLKRYSNLILSTSGWLKVKRSNDVETWACYWKSGKWIDYENKILNDIVYWRKVKDIPNFLPKLVI